MLILNISKLVLATSATLNAVIVIQKHLVVIIKKLNNMEHTLLAITGSMLTIFLSMKKKQILT
jgi:hypothetical protein